MSRLIGGIFLTVGLAVSSGGAYLFLGTQDLLSHGMRSSGKVVELSKSGTSRAYSPIIQFETAEHKTITAASKMASNPPSHNAGDTVTVIYRAGSPEDFSLDEPFELWFLPGLFGGLGLIFVTIGGGMLIYSLIRRPPAKATNRNTSKNTWDKL